MDLWRHSPGQFEPEPHAALHSLIFPTKADGEPDAFTGLAWCDKSGYYSGCYGFRHWVPYHAFIPLCNVFGDQEADAASLLAVSGQVDPANHPDGVTLTWNEASWKFLRSAQSDFNIDVNLFLGQPSSEGRRPLLAVFATDSYIYLALLDAEYNTDRVAGRMLVAVDNFLAGITYQIDDECDGDCQWFFYEPEKYSSAQVELDYMRSDVPKVEFLASSEEPHAEPQAQTPYDRHPSLSPSTEVDAHLEWPVEAEGEWDEEWDGEEERKDEETEGRKNDVNDY